VPVAERAERLSRQTRCGQTHARETSGLVAWLDGEPAGWCAVEPRPAYAGLLRVYRVPWIDREEDRNDTGIWAITCFHIRAGYRRRGISRALARAAIDFARVGAQKLWAGTVTIRPDAKTGAHHHGHLESVIYVVRGKARMRWGEHLQFTAEAGPGDFIFVPPYVPHQEINASPDEVLECVLVRSDNEAVVVNLDIEPAERPEGVAWVDPIHKA